MSTRRRKRILLTRVAPARRRAAVRVDSDYGVRAEPDWRRVPWSQHLHDTDIDGRSVHYVDIGSGPPVVLIHGLGSCWQMWVETIPRLAQERRVIAIDLPGFGRSQMPVEQISITLFARTVDALCEQLGIESVAIVGHSMGGFTAAEVALRHSTRVQRLVLVGAAGISSSDVMPQPGLAFLTGLQLLAPKDDALQRQILARPGLRHAMFASIARHPTLIDPAVLYEQVQRFPRPGLVPSFAALTGYDFRERLGDISCPALVIHGRNDMLVPVADADGYADALPDARTLIFDDTGHCPMIERPQRFNEELLRFLGAAVAAPVAVAEPELEPEPEPAAAD